MDIIYMTNKPTTQPYTKFEWPIYADATLAGLAILIPIPGIDWLFETFFKRRMPRAIIRHRQQEVAPPIITILNKDPNAKGCWRSCLTLPIWGLIALIKKLSRKILYFLTVKEATDKTSYYWSQAFLIDYMLLAGYLKNTESAQLAHQAMARVLEANATSPLLQLAQKIITGPKYIFSSLRKARQGDESELIQEKKSILAKAWDDFEDYFNDLAVDFDKTYQEVYQEFLSQELKIDDS